MGTLAGTPQTLAPAQIRYESGGAIEEILNSLTHAIGAGLSIAGLVVLMVLIRSEPSGYKYVSFSIYGATQIALYLASALTHSMAAYPRVRSVLRVLDQSAIFLLIAGTYTPVALLVLRGAWGWSIFGVIWGCALIGVLVKTCFPQLKSLWADLLYLPMGWLIVIAVRPLIQTAPPGLLIWMSIGALCYTVGVIFYALRRLPFAHVVWHLFVVGGSVGFFLGFARHVA